MPTVAPRRPPRRTLLTLPVIAAALVAMTATTVVAAAPSPSPGPGVTGAIDHPTGPLDVVLSMETGGGHVPFGYLVTQAPTFVLYGDGSVVFRPSLDPEGDGLPQFVRATLSTAQVDALLTYALTEGGLADAKPEYLEMLVTDMPTTVFRVDAAGLSRSVAVYALGMGQHSGPDAADYRALEDLGVLLASFEDQVAKGNVLTTELFQPTLYRAVLNESTPDVDAVLDWPWTDLGPGDFVRMADDPSHGLAGLTPDQAARVGAIPSGGGYGIFLKASDGTVYHLAYRPLLPGEDLAPAF